MMSRWRKAYSGVGEYWKTIFAADLGTGKAARLLQAKATIWNASYCAACPFTAFSPYNQLLFSYFRLTLWNTGQDTHIIRT
jgi:hypothetical protein